MPELIHPDDRPDAAERFRADLAGYLRERSGPELADLLDGLPDLVKADLISELAGRGPAWLRLPPDWPGNSDAEHTRRRSLQEVVADRWAARAARRASPPPGAALRGGWLPAPTAACQPPTRPEGGGWGRRATRPRHPAQEQDERAAMGWQDPAAQPARSGPRRAGGTGGSATTADPCIEQFDTYARRSARLPDPDPVSAHAGACPAQEAQHA
jgi:hypothetical protein